MKEDMIQDLNAIDESVEKTHYLLSEFNKKYGNCLPNYESIPKYIRRYALAWDNVLWVQLDRAIKRFSD